MYKFEGEIFAGCPVLLHCIVFRFTIIYHLPHCIKENAIIYYVAFKDHKILIYIFEELTLY